MRPARSLLLVPAEVPAILDRDGGDAADAVIFDLAVELADEVLRSGCEMVRRRMAEAPDRRWLIRAALPLIEAGLAIDAPVEAIVLQGVRYPEEVLRADPNLAATETRLGVPPGSIGAIIEIDNTRAAFFAHELAAASPRVVSVCFNGAEHGALQGDLACAWSMDGPELMFARQYALVAARAANLDCPLDGSFVRLADLDGLSRDTEISRRLGYRGRIVLDPRQIETANRIYSPTSEELAYHRRVLAALDAAIAEGKASVTLDGKMIDYAHAATARSVMDEARQWGIAP